jgi:hypothetical protein
MERRSNIVGKVIGQEEDSELAREFLKGTDLSMN